MNKEFVKKMVKAEILRYEAIKEVLPERLKNRVDKIQKNTVSLIKDIAVEILKENVSEQEAKAKKETKKVEVDFS